MAVYIYDLEMPGSCNECAFELSGKCLINANIKDGNGITQSCPLTPAADVRPVVRGRNVSDSGFMCSVCTFGDFGGFHGYKPHYCPNCGAEMKEDEG